MQEGENQLCASFVYSVELSPSQVLKIIKITIIIIMKMKITMTIKTTTIIIKIVRTILIIKPIVIIIYNNYSKQLTCEPFLFSLFQNPFLEVRLRVSEMSILREWRLPNWNQRVLLSQVVNIIQCNASSFEESWTENCPIVE